jgi:hypothetical protein
MVDYNNYTKFIDTIVDGKDFINFKENSVYRGILEHVNYNQGSQYLEYIKSTTNITDYEIAEYCELNDLLGNPVKSVYGTLKTSPTSLRYIFHAHLILSHIKSLSLPIINIVEVGGGYGGLCLAINHFANKYNVKINSYTIIDLSSPIKLQQLYLKTLNQTPNVSFVDANTFGESITHNNMFMISNYCFSEISTSFRNSYIEKLIPKVSHGFMAWNFIPVFDFGFKLKIEDEYPNTEGQYNKYVYF